MYGINDIKHYEELQNIMCEFYEYLVENGYNAKIRYASSQAMYYGQTNISQVWIDIDETSITATPYYIEKDNNDILFGIYGTPGDRCSQSKCIKKDTKLNNEYIMDLLIEENVIKPKQISIFDFVY